MSEFQTLQQFRALYPQYDDVDDQTLSAKIYEKKYAGTMSQEDFMSEFAPVSISTSNTSLADFRAQYPQYDDLDDATLTQAIAKKQGQSKPEESESPGLLSRVGKVIGGGVGAIDSAITGGARALHGAVAGDAEFDATSALGLGKVSPTTRLKAMAGDDSDYEREILQENPGAVAKEDANGNRYILFEDGQIGYVNRPGLDREDIERFGAKTLAFIPAARAVSAMGNVAGRIAVGGLGAGATDAALQSASGREEIDKAQVAITGILGAGSEAAAPMVARALKSVRGRGMSVLERGRAVARESNIEDLSDDQLKKLGRLSIQSGDAIDPAVRDASVEYGFEYSKGGAMASKTAKQRTAKDAQLSYEEGLGQLSGGQPLRDMKALNVDRVDENVNRMVGKMGQNRNANQAAESAGHAVRASRERYRQAVKEAYDNAGTYDVSIDESMVDILPDRARAEIQLQGHYLDSETPAGKNALKALDDFVANSDDYSFKRLEKLRREVANKYGTAKNNSDRAIVQIVKKEFDTAIDDAIDMRLYSGDPDAVEAIKSARGVHADYMRRFKSDTEAGKIIQKMSDAEATPEQIAQWMVGANGISKPGAANVVRKFREATTDDPEAINHLKQMVFYKLMTNPKQDSAHMPGKIISNVNDAMGDKGESLMKELFDETERNQIKRFAKALDTLVVKGDRAKSSGTDERKVRVVAAMAGGLRNSPIASFIPHVIDSYKTNAVMKLPTMPAPRFNVSAPVAATYTSQ